MYEKGIFVIPYEIHLSTRQPKSYMQKVKWKSICLIVLKHLFDSFKIFVLPHHHAHAQPLRF